MAKYSKKFLGVTSALNLLLNSDDLSESEVRQMIAQIKRSKVILTLAPVIVFALIKSFI